MHTHKGGGDIYPSINCDRGDCFWHSVIKRLILKCEVTGEVPPSFENEILRWNILHDLLEIGYFIYWIFQINCQIRSAWNKYRVFFFFIVILINFVFKTILEAKRFSPSTLNVLHTHTYIDTEYTHIYVRTYIYNYTDVHILRFKERALLISSIDVKHKITGKKLPKGEGLRLLFLKELIIFFFPTF